MTDGSLHSEQGQRFAWQQSSMNGGDPAQRPDRPLRDGVDEPCRSSLSVIAAREIRQPKVVGSPNQRTRWQPEPIEPGHHAIGGRCSLVDKRCREGGEQRLVLAAAKVNAILLIHEAQQGCRDATYEPSRFPVAVPYPSPHRATPAYVVVTSSDLDTSKNKTSVRGLSWISRNAIDIAATDPLPLRRKATIRVFWIWHRWMTAVQWWDEPNPDEAFMTAIDTRRDAEPDEI